MILIIIGSLLDFMSFMGFISVLSGKHPNPVVGSIIYAVFLVLGTILILLGIRRRKQKKLSIKNQLNTGNTTGTKEASSKVEFDANGKVLTIEVPQGQWTREQKGQAGYYTQKANSLLQAAEILKKIDSVPQLTYYVVNTPDGSLGRDLQGYYTEAPIKMKNIIVESGCGKSEAVQFSSLKDFGNKFANQTTVAHLKSVGKYSRLILLMKCGHCGYESPVETQPGSLVRECYCCGAENRGHRGEINIILGSHTVGI